MLAAFALPIKTGGGFVEVAAIIGGINGQQDLHDLAVRAVKAHRQLPAAKGLRVIKPHVRVGDGVHNHPHFRRRVRPVVDKLGGRADDRAAKACIWRGGRRESADDLAEAAGRAFSVGIHTQNAIR